MELQLLDINAMGINPGLSPFLSSLQLPLKKETNLSNFKRKEYGNANGCYRMKEAVCLVLLQWMVML
jgi:hypothetical protein